MGGEGKSFAWEERHARCVGEFIAFLFEFIMTLIFVQLKVSWTKIRLAGLEFTDHFNGIVDFTGVDKSDHIGICGD